MTFQFQSQVKNVHGFIFYTYKHCNNRMYQNGKPAYINPSGSYNSHFWQYMIKIVTNNFGMVIDHLDTYISQKVILKS